MEKDNLKDKIRRNILKFIFCGQKIFKADNMWFHNGRPTTVKNAMIAENANYILKLQIYRHRLKYNDINDEAEILKYLKEKGALCQPIIKSQGKDIFKRSWFIMEKINNKEGIVLADVLFALLEQHKFGVFHGDTKTDNVCFNGLIAKLIDYDQSQIREEAISLNPKESIMFFINKLSHVWQYKNKLLDIGQGIEEVTNNCMSNFIGDAFNFSKTNLYKSFKEMPFWTLDEEEIKSEGKISIKNWVEKLAEIELKANEKVLEINPDVGTFSRYLYKRGCNVSAYSKCENEIYATKIISNILNCKINIINELNNFNNQFDTIFAIKEPENIEFSQFKNAKRIVIRKENNANSKINIPKNYIELKNIQLDKNSKLVIFENKDET